MGSSKVALVTGSSRGIGRFLSEKFVRRGFRVAGCSRETADWSLEGYTHYTVNVSEDAQVRQLFQTIRSEYGRIDVAVNNAGIASMNHSLLTPAESAQRVLNVNVLGTFLVCREAAKLMRRVGGGRIVNMSSVAVPLRLEGEAIYAASKAAVEMLTSVLSKEFSGWNITVNAVGPGPVSNTGLIKGLPPEKLQSLLKRLALPQMNTLQDVWNAVEFFIREDNAHVTGQVMYLGGV